MVENGEDIIYSISTTLRLYHVFFFKFFYYDSESLNYFSTYKL